MDKKLIGIVIGVVVILGLGAYMAFALKATPSPSEQVGTNEQPKVRAGESKSFKDLILAGAPTTCSYDDIIEGTRTNGKIFVGSGKMRSDFSTTGSDNKTTSGHMILVNETAHVWMDDSSTGMKMSMKDTTNLSAEQKSQGVDPDKKYNVNCESWSVDQSVFNLPTGVTFQELNLGAMMGATGTGSAGAATANPDDVKAFACGICDQAPEGEPRTACKAQYGCQ